VKPPEVLIPEVLLAGKVHSIYSAGGTGKTFMMLYLVKRVVERGEPVMIFDLENGLRIMAERLELLGVTPEEAERIHYYPFPSMPMDPDVIRAFAALLEEVDPALVVFDSWVNCLAACGLDENKSTDIAAWADAYSQKARLRRSAVLILDHVPKEGGSARGSGRKLDYVDVQFELRSPQPFDRETVGRVDLHLRKDREGWLPATLPTQSAVRKTGLCSSDPPASLSGATRKG
jgi:RecA-family ATPase